MLLPTYSLWISVRPKSFFPIRDHLLALMAAQFLGPKYRHHARACQTAVKTQLMVLWAA
jgi:hypothetical protein